jgi:hypothetical protein
MTMLYDPKWEKQNDQKTDPFSLAALIAWLEQQDPEKSYCYLNNGECLLAQYFTACGYKRPNLADTSFWQMDDICAPQIHFPVAFNLVAVASPRTFGAALDRARTAARKSAD